MIPRLLVLLAGLLTGLACAAAELIVSPLHGPADQPVRIAVQGLLPAQPVTLHLGMTDGGGVRWTAQATYRADLDGVVDTAQAGAEDGSYAGVDPMGLFWSMTPEDDRGRPHPFPLRREDDGLLFRPVEFDLEVRIDGVPEVRATLQRWVGGPEVRAQRLDAPGLVANLYFPHDALNDGRRHPAVITLGGAEGGIDSANYYAAWLASHGFVAMAVAYYRMPGLPKDLVRVPVDPVSAAVDWLAAQPFVDAERIGAMGGSWGGIVAMAAAAHDPRLRAVVSWVGSPAPFRGIRRDVPPGDFRAVDEPALTWQGRDLPFLPYREDTNWADPHDLDIVRDLDHAMLPIERINGPLLLVAGGDDRLGASGTMAAVAMRHLARHPRAFDDRALYYSDAGHLISQLYQPTTWRNRSGPYVSVGGTPAGYARADRESGAEVIAFLRRALLPLP